jgi:hypothetical protein
MTQWWRRQLVLTVLIALGLADAALAAGARLDPVRNLSAFIFRLYG